MANFARGIGVEARGKIVMAAGLSCHETGFRVETLPETDTMQGTPAVVVGRHLGTAAPITVQ